MTAFYFDVGGVLIPDKLAPGNALQVFQELGQRYNFDPAAAHAEYTRLQPSLDLGGTSLAHLCTAIGIELQAFEQEWLTMHPLDGEALSLIERLVARGHSVGLATNFCRPLLDLLIESSSALTTLGICCSSSIGVPKPSADFFDSASRIINSSEIVFVDDRAVNVEAARRFGWTALRAVKGWVARFERAYLMGCAA